MENGYGFAIIIGMCVIVLAIVSFQRKSEIIINFIFRAVMGTIGIYFINQLLVWQQIDLSIGLNPLTVLTSGTLGFPGLVLLYGINLYGLL